MEQSNCTSSRRHTTSGFTLIELMVTILVVAVLAAIAAPNMRTFILNNRLSSTAAEMLRSIQTARTEAVKRQQNVEVCLSANPTAGDSAACSTSGVTGWIVFQDTNANWTRDTGEELIETHTFESDKIYVLADYDKLLSYSATGFATPAKAKTPSQSIVMCDDRGNVDIGGQSAARGIVISTTGRARMTRVVNSSSDSADITDLLASIGSSCPP